MPGRVAADTWVPEMFWSIPSKDADFWFDMYRYMFYMYRYIASQNFGEVQVYRYMSNTWRDIQHVPVHLQHVPIHLRKEEPKEKSVRIPQCTDTWIPCTDTSPTEKPMYRYIRPSTDTKRSQSRSVSISLMYRYIITWCTDTSPDPDLEFEFDVPIHLFHVPVHHDAEFNFWIV